MSKYDEPLWFAYNFTEQETEILAKYVREHPLPSGLWRVREAVIKTVYKTMTIDEAEDCFKDTD